MNGQLWSMRVHLPNGKVRKDYFSSKQRGSLERDKDGYLIRHHEPNRRFRKMLYDPLLGWYKPKKKGPRGLVGVK